MSVPFAVELEDFTLKVATPLVVLCGDVVRSVVLPPVPLKLTETPLVVERLFFASTVLTVARDVDDPSDTMLSGDARHASVAGPRGVNVMSAVVELTLEPPLNVTVQVVAKSDLNTNRA